MTKKYTQIFFDLDKTIWDFETNSQQTIAEIYNLLCFDKRNIADFAQFHAVYETHNLKLWEMYRYNKIAKPDLMVMRFYNTLMEFGINDMPTAQAFSTQYLELLPEKTAVFAGTHQTLAYLAGKYQLHIITNGFEEVQFRKIQNADMRHYFIHIITSEEAGFKKPDTRIFNYALQLCGASADQCLMVGDDLEVDVLGAKQAGMDQVYFNPQKLAHHETITYEIAELTALCGLI
ncbi:MAG: YjjG family noncanonical pyrimidine nucleotidase [Bacteroidota bacterium]